MITIITSSKPINKLIKSIGSGECDTESRAAFNNAKLSLSDPNSASEMRLLLDSLSTNQAIAFGLSSYDTIDLNHRRTRQNFNRIDNPWIAFDGDYIIKDKDNNEYTLSVDNLIKLDPQLKEARHVIRPSSTTICHPHKKKIWYQIHSNDWEQVKAYADRLFKFAIIEGMGQYLLSKSDDSYSVYLRTIFDASVFTPERIFFESRPSSEDPEIAEQIEQIYSQQTQVFDSEYMIEPDNLRELTEFEEIQYKEIVTQLRQQVAPLVAEKKKYVINRYPHRAKQLNTIEKGLVHDRIYLDSEPRNDSNPDSDSDTYQGSDSDNGIMVYTDDTYPYIKVIDLVIDVTKHGTSSRYNNLVIRDPFDPNYGTSKAKIYVNENNYAATDSSTVSGPTIYIHSFAHGSNSYRVAAPLNKLNKVMDLDIPKKDITTSVKYEIYEKLIRVLPLFYFQYNDEVEFVSSNILRPFMSPSSSKKIIMQHAVSVHQLLVDQLQLSSRYFLLVEGSAPFLYYDEEEGIKSILRAGLKTYLENKVPGVSGGELLDTLLKDPNRKDVTGFGLYYPDNVPNHRMTLYRGPQAVKLHQSVSEEQIELFLEHIKLFTENDRQYNWVLDWLADLVQNPLRKGPRSAISIKGLPRTGKSLWAERVMSFFKKANSMEVVTSDRITARFNAHLASKIIVSMAELTLNGESAKDIRNIMKSFITDPTFVVELKSGATTQVPNHMHFIHTTNYSASYLFDSEDVRWSVFKFRPDYRQDYEYWGKQVEWWKEEGKDLTYTYLMERQYDVRNIVEKVPTREGLQEKLATMTPIDRWILMILKNSKHTVTVEKRQLYDSYKAFTQEHSKYPPMSIKMFGKYLNDTNRIFREKGRNSRIIEPEEDFKKFVYARSMDGLTMEMIEDEDFDLILTTDITKIPEDL